MKRKTVWLHVSIEVDVDSDVDDDTVMDYLSDELIDEGYTIDDMGIYEIEQQQETKQ